MSGLASISFDDFARCCRQPPFWYLYFSYFTWMIFAHFGSSPHFWVGLRALCLNNFRVYLIARSPPPIAFVASPWGLRQAALSFLSFKERSGFLASQRPLASFAPFVPLVSVSLFLVSRVFLSRLRGSVEVQNRFAIASLAYWRFSWLMSIRHPLISRCPSARSYATRWGSSQWTAW